jgi:hypothetical protein
VTKTVMVSPSGIMGPCEGFFPSMQTHLARSARRSSCSPATYNACGCGHGGTRNRSTCRRVQTWSVNPAAGALTLMAGHR